MFLINWCGGVGTGVGEGSSSSWWNHLWLVSFGSIIWVIQGGNRFSPDPDRLYNLWVSAGNPLLVLVTVLDSLSCRYQRMCGRDYEWNWNQTAAPVHHYGSGSFLSILVVHPDFLSCLFKESVDQITNGTQAKLWLRCIITAHGVFCRFLWLILIPWSHWVACSKENVDQIAYGTQIKLWLRCFSGWSFRLYFRTWLLRQEVGDEGHHSLCHIISPRFLTGWVVRTRKITDVTDLPFWCDPEEEV